MMVHVDYVVLKNYGRMECEPAYLVKNMIKTLESVLVR